MLYFACREAYIGSSPLSVTSTADGYTAILSSSKFDAKAPLRVTLTGWLAASKAIAELSRRTSFALSVLPSPWLRFTQ